MTHGCLVIQKFCETHRRVLLHTYHTGMDIPKWVKAAPGFDIVTYAAPILVGAKKKDYKCVSALRDFIHSCSITSDYDWPPVVAAMIIAAQPRSLHPLFPGYECELPRWSGLSDPYILMTDAGPERNLWILSRGAEKLLEFSPYEKAEEALIAWVKSGKRDFPCEDPEVSNAKENDQKKAKRKRP